MGKVVFSLCVWVMCLFGVIFVGNSIDFRYMMVLLLRLCWCILVVSFNLLYIVLGMFFSVRVVGMIDLFNMELLWF